LPLLNKKGKKKERGTDKKSFPTPKQRKRKREIPHAHGKRAMKMVHRVKGEKGNEMSIATGRGGELLLRHSSRKIGVGKKKVEADVNPGWSLEGKEEEGQKKKTHDLCPWKKRKGFPTSEKKRERVKEKGPSTSRTEKGDS